MTDPLDDLLRHRGRLAWIVLRLRVRLSDAPGDFKSWLRFRFGILLTRADRGYLVDILEETIAEDYDDAVYMADVLMRTLDWG